MNDPAQERTDEYLDAIDAMTEAQRHYYVTLVAIMDEINRQSEARWARLDAMPEVAFRRTT